MGTLGAYMWMMLTWQSTLCLPHYLKVLGRCCWRQPPVVSVGRVLLGRELRVWCVTGATPPSICTVHTSPEFPPHIGTAKGANPTSLHVGSGALLRTHCCSAI